MRKYIFSTLNQHIHHEFSLNHKKIISFSISNHLRLLLLQHTTSFQCHFSHCPLSSICSLFFYLLKPNIAVGQCLSSFIQMRFIRWNKGGETKREHLRFPQLLSVLVATIHISSNSVHVSTNFDSFSRETVGVPDGLKSGDSIEIYWKEGTKCDCFVSVGDLKDDLLSIQAYMRCRQKR